MSATPTRPPSAACNETQSTCNESRCLLCGEPFEVQPIGRPRRFCSPAHRVRYHRLHKCIDPARPTLVAAATVLAEPPARRVIGNAEQARALRDVVDRLEELHPPGWVADLRRLANYANELSIASETIKELEPKLDDYEEVRCVLALLQDHRHTLERLAGLDWLADDVGKLAHDLREARGYQDDLESAIEELEEHDEALP